MKIADRAIKFRAWAVYGEMLPNVQNHIGNESSAFGNMLNNSTDFKIMQFTGLQDVNGVDIYEGDVLRCYPDDITLSYNKTVEWDSNRCELGITTNGRSGVVLCKAASKSYEIIGNIYENKDLLC